MSHILDVQETNSSLSQQCRILNCFIGRRPGKGRHTKITIVGFVFDAFSHSDACGHFQRPSGKRHSLAQFVNNLSFNVVDHVLSNNPESSFSARLFVFEDNEVGILMIKARVDVDWHHRKSIWTTQFPLEMCAQQNN